MKTSSGSSHARRSTRRLSRETELPALVALYNATGGASWRDQNGWLTGYACTGTAPFYLTPAWDRVSACNWGEVSRLVLSDNSLVGTLPSEAGALTSLLYSFSVARNRLSGTLTPSLGQLGRVRNPHLARPMARAETSLRSRHSSCTLLQTHPCRPPPRQLRDLRAEANVLSGTIPSELGEMVSLRSLQLQHNELSGTLPTQLARLTDLQTLCAAPAPEARACRTSFARAAVAVLFPCLASQSNIAAHTVPLLIVSASTL